MLHSFITLVKNYPSIAYIALFILLIFIYASPGERWEAFFDLLKSFSCGYKTSDQCEDWWG